MPLSPSPILEIHALSLHLGGRPILEAVHLTLFPGDFLGIIGPNGGGKSSLLRVIAGLLAPTSGSLRWPDSTSRPALGYLPQRVAPDPSLPFSAREVLLQASVNPRPGHSAPRRQRLSKVDSWLDRVGLTPHANTRLVHLSGGQQRRLLLACALIHQPRLLLLDEPTAGLDSDGLDRCAHLLAQLPHQGITTLLVSHDRPLLQRLASQIACLNGSLLDHRPARIADPSLLPPRADGELTGSLPATTFRAPPAPVPAS